MSVFMVERDLKGISIEALGRAQKAAISKAAEMREAGTNIHYLRSRFAPRTDVACVCSRLLQRRRSSG